mgnify:CR=1 FL=1
MKNKALQTRLSDEVMTFLQSRKSLHLASLGVDGAPFASYAPFAVGEECLYVLLSEIATHGINLHRNPRASVLEVQDEDTALGYLSARHGQRPINLSKLQDFKMFRLNPRGGRYVKGFGKAYSLAGNTLAGEALTHLTDGHKPRAGSATE